VDGASLVALHSFSSFASNSLPTRRDPIMPTPTPTTAPSSAGLPVISRVEGAGVSSSSTSTITASPSTVCLFVTLVAHIARAARHGKS